MGRGRRRRLQLPNREQHGTAALALGLGAAATREPRLDWLWEALSPIPPADPKRPVRWQFEHRLAAETLARKCRSLTQEGLAETAGLGRNYLTSLERGGVNPTFESLVRLSRALDRALSEFASEIEAPVASAR